MSFAYISRPSSEEESIAVIREAIARGCMLDTSDIYGPHTNEELIGKALKGIPRESYVLATKFGVTPEGAVRGDRAYVREALEGSLRRLGVDYVDLYYVHRKDRRVPVEETFEELSALVREGKVRYLGVSEFSPENVRRAHAVHPISAAQIEWSLWTRDVERELVPTLRELGIGIVPYSPLGRGFLTGQITTRSQLVEGDRRRSHPRFQEGAFEENMKLVQAVRELAEAKGVTASQLALAWVLSRGPDVVPIPGTKRIEYLESNLAAAELALSQDEIDTLTRLSDAATIVGERTAADFSRYAYTMDGAL